MKPFAHTFFAVLSSAFLVSGPQDPKDSGQGPPKTHPITRHPLEEQERLTKELDGSWILLGFDEPNEEAFDDTALEGFATFHDGFLTLVIEGSALEAHFFRGVKEHLFVQAGAYRYRINELGDLETASVVSFSNTNPDGDLADESGKASEYQVRLEDDELKLRNETGGVLTFRRTKAGEFPANAVTSLERRRSGTPTWQDGR